MSTRAKYICIEVAKRTGWNNNDKAFLYIAKFMPVTGGSDENKQFFAYTPVGNIEIGQYKEDVFVPGKEYYVDFTEAAP
jgi:hypothetical protein